MSYSRVLEHRPMVFDGRRNAAYARAMEKVITPDSVVMDVGAGLGVHGLNAAALGAAEVHLVEPSPVLEVARQVAEYNGLSNVYYHPVRVEELTEDIPVDVIVSVFTGNFLLTEDLLPSLFYARDRFLVPKGTLIPGRARMELVPVGAEDFYTEHVAGWGASLEFCRNHKLPLVNYGLVGGYAANSLHYGSAEDFAATPMAMPMTILELDFYSAERADCDHTIEVGITRDGVCHGWVGWFSMHMGDNWLSTGLDDEATHWRQVFLPLETPLELRAGETISLRLKRPEYGEWTWITNAKDSRQRQSTFLSRPFGREEVQKKSRQYSPTLNRRGEAAVDALARMQGQAETKSIAELIYSEYRDIFTNEQEASRFLASLAKLYS